MTAIDILVESKKQMDIYAKQIGCYCRICNSEIGELHIYKTTDFFNLAHQANAIINKDGTHMNFTYAGITFKNIFDKDDD